MREVICINIGQAGVQLSNATWELFCMEHGIEANGLLKEKLQDDATESFRTFFQEVPTGQFVPRAVSIDLEPTVIDEIRSGPYRNLFHPDQLMSSMEDGASNFARGFFTIGKRQIEPLSDTVRKLVDACDMLQGFFVLHGVAGGTGSGFSTLTLETLTLEYTKRNKFQLSVFPSPALATAVVEPYNTVLASVRALENCDMSCVMDNEAIYAICVGALGVVRPTYCNINRVVAQVFSDLTTSLRFEGALNSDLDQLCTNLIPYPRIHFPVLCHSPLTSASKAGHEPMSTVQLTKSLFDGSNQMVSCALADGKYMCCVLQYRGRITPKQVNQSIFEVKRKNDVKFVDWCPTGFKLGINNQPPICVPGSDMAQTDRSVTLLANSTSIKEVWDKLIQKFDILFAKRSFVHWYVGEGMEEGEFNEARDEASAIFLDYMELEAADDDAAGGAGAQDADGDAHDGAGAPAAQEEPDEPRGYYNDDGNEGADDQGDEAGADAQPDNDAAAREDEDEADAEDEESETDN